MSARSVLMMINTTGLEYDDRLRKEVGSLRAAGAQVGVVALEYANRAARSQVYDGVPARTMRLRSRAWLPQGRGLAVKTAEMSLRFFARAIIDRPDVVWCHDLELGPLVVGLALLRALGLITRIVWDQHELPADSLRLRPAYRWLFARVVNLCDAVVMANAERRALILDWLSDPFGPPIAVLNNYPDAMFAALPVRDLPADVVSWLDGRPYLLAQGGANPDRHLEALVAAIRRTPRFQLIVVGPYRAKVLEALRRDDPAIDEQVRFTGPVAQMELTRFIDHAHGSVVLYQAHSANTVLCAPNRLYQALVRRVPVLVGSNPPMADVVKALGCGVVLKSDGGDVDDLYAAIRQLGDEHARFQAAAATARDMTWDAQDATVARIADVDPVPAIPTSCTAACLLPIATDARIHRRLVALARLGVTPQVLAFERPSYSGKSFPGGYQSLGVVPHGRYLSRLRPLFTALGKVRAACAGADIVYAFSMDLLALAWLATRAQRRRPRLVYEVADIHPILVGRGLRAIVMRAIERRLLRDTSLLVVTSEAFVTGFYREIQGLSNLRYELVENKPERVSVAVNANRQRDADRPITIGYFGVLRCAHSWAALQQIAKAGQGRIRIYLRGVPLNLPKFEAERQQSWIEYGGPYVAPDELQGMYDSIDLLWVAHHVDANNSLLWNRTNRFYEGCAFQTPMIAQIGTQDGAVIAGHGLGPSVDLLRPDAMIDRIGRITPGDIECWRDNLARLPPSLYCENGEHERLTLQLRTLAAAPASPGQGRSPVTVFQNPSAAPPTPSRNVLHR